MTLGPLTLAKPSMAPPFHSRWVPFQEWSPLMGSQVLAWWKTVTGLPPASRLKLVGWPSGPRVKPSPRPKVPKYWS